MDNSDEDHCGGSGFGMDFSVLFSRPFLGVKVAGSMEILKLLFSSNHKSLIAKATPIQRSS